MKGTPTHYYCDCSYGIQTKNKLQAQFSDFLKGIHGELYRAADVSKIKSYIIEKAKELNQEYPRCAPLNVKFSEYEFGCRLNGFEFNYFILKPAYLIKL